MNHGPITDTTPLTPQVQDVWLTTNRNEQVVMRATVANSSIVIGTIVSCDGDVEGYEGDASIDTFIDAFADEDAAFDAICDRWKFRLKGGEPAAAEPIDKPSAQSNSPVAIARGYLERGWNPIPVSLKTKKPIGKAWQHRQLDSNTIAEAFNRANMNVGVQLGPMSGGLTDVDLDCREAVAIGGMLLPASNNIFGRPSKPRSHWLYRTTLADKIAKACLQFRDADGAMMLELKIGGKGSQSVFPGSTHTSGEAIAWDRDGALATVDDDLVLRQVRRLAVATMLARHWPAEGGRHDAALTVGGFLARAGLDEDETALMVKAIATGAGDEQVADRAQAGRDAVAGHRNGEKTYGFPTLVKTFGEQVASNAAEWLSYTPQALATTDGVEFRDLDKNDYPKPSLANAVIAIRALGIVARHDLFRHRITVEYNGDAKTIREGLLTDDAVGAIRSLINNTYRIDCGDNTTLAAVKEVARSNAFDPVLDMLDACQAKWDGVKRLDSWVVDYLGCQGTALERAIGRLWLIAACRRARVPGCKFDQIIVEEGPEGINKSTSIRVLAGDEYFSDQSILGASDKDVQEQLDGVWMHENADLAGMRKAEVEKVKAFARRQVDRARPAYGHVREDRPRRSTETGTTNEDTYMLSQTGNRCFWPLKTGKIDIAALIRDREQLLGEAATYEAAGASIVLDEKLWGAAKAAQEQRRVRDTWEDILIAIPDNLVHKSGDGYERVASADLLRHVLNIPEERQVPIHGQRLATVMKLLKWERNDSGSVNIDGKPVRGYLRQTPALEAGEETRSHIESSLVRFINHFAGSGHAMWTDRASPGRDRPISPLKDPERGRPIYIQVVRDQRRILISRQAFYDFLKKEGIERSQVLAGLIKFFNAKETQLTLGAGTIYGRAQEAVIEIPVPPELALLQDLLCAQGPPQGG